MRYSGFFFVFLVAALLWSMPQSSAASDSASDLGRSVRKLNYWLLGSSEAEGWRRFLQLNILEAQTAKGAAADVWTLKQISDRFHSGAAGLEHPRFVEVRNAIDAHLNQLMSVQSNDPVFAVDQALGQFRRISIADMQQSRDQAVAELELLIRHYRRTMYSRQRAEIFFDLDLDAMLAMLREVEFLLAPEVSVGKLDSMIRDVRAEADKVEAKIDALPLTPIPDNDPALEPPAPDNSNNSPSTQEPSEDQKQESRQELEARKKQLDERIAKLRERRAEVLREDRPRRTRRVQTLRKLQGFETNLIKVSKRRGDPFFVSAATAYEKFFRLYFYGTGDNLQEDYLRRLAELRTNLSEVNGPDKRKALGLLGDHLRWLDYANQAPQLVNLIRLRYSQPNAYLSIDSQLINQLASQTINESEPMRQNISGRLVRGNINTTGNIAIDLIEDPNQVHASIHLLGQVGISSYLQQGKLQVFTSTNGHVEGRQSIYANVGGFFSGQPQVAANFRADFLGTTSRLRLVNRIASQKFEEARSEAESGAAQQAEDQIRERFVSQTKAPIEKAQQTLASRLKEALKSSSRLPELYLRSSSQRLLAIARNDSISTLAAGNRPSDFGVQPQIAARVHETMLTNFLEAAFAGKTFNNDELAVQIADLVGQDPESIRPAKNEQDEDADEPFSITFANIRPIEFQFEDQGFAIVVSGRAFSQGKKQIREGLNIILRFRIQNVNGQLKLVRNGPVDFSYPGRKSPRVVGFKSFLDDRLNKQLDDQDTDVDLPANLIPIDQVKALQNSPLAKRLRLVQFRVENGWLYAGWNLAPESGLHMSWIYDLPAIWNEVTITDTIPSYSDQSTVTQ